MDTLFLPQANLLLACLETALAANPNPPAKICLAWDDPIANLGLDGDDCCEGTAYVNMIEYYPSSNLFPDRTIERQSGPCGVVAWALRLQATVFRCWPDDGLTRISCAEQTAAVEQLYHDAQAIRTALCCFKAANQAGLTPANRGLLIAITDNQPIAPQGGCAGNKGTVSVQVPQCGQC